MSQERSAQKNVGQPTGRKGIRKSGREKSGKRREKDSLPKTHFVCRAMIQAKCHIIPELKYTDGPNIWIYQKPKVIASGVIQVSIAVDSGAENVKRLERNKKVEFAIDALMQTIRNELYLKESTGSGNGTGTNNSRDSGQESGRKQSNAKV